MREARAVTALTLAALAATPAGCRGRSPADVVAEHRAAAGAQLARLEAVGRLAQEASPLASDAVEVKGPPPEFPPALGRENAVALDAEHFEDLAADPKGFRLVATNRLADAVSLLRRGTLANGSAPEDPARTEETLLRFLGLRYVLVLRTTGGIDPRTVDLITFTGGRWEGEARLYDLSTGTPAGGFRFVAENDQTVEVAQGDPSGGLAGNLRGNALGLIRAEFERRFPNASAPFGDEEQARVRAGLEAAKR